MNVVMLSHPLHSAGMKLLEKQPNTQVLVMNQNDLSVSAKEFQQANAFILRVGKITGEMIRSAPNLKVIARPGVGVDTIDVQAATQLGIPVVVTPGANTRSVAEHTIALLFALSKNLIESLEQTKSGNFNIRNQYTSFELQGKTLGVLGFGAIGREVAKMASLLGIQISVYDPYLKAEQVQKLGYNYFKDLDTLLPLCDMITLHMPSTPQTKQILNGQRLSLMKPGALLINCARGDLLDEEALYLLLKEKHLAGAAVDVMSQEPFEPDTPLFSLPNFLATPHMAALTNESATRCAVMAVEGTLAILQGERWSHVCNPEVYSHPRWS